MSGAFLSSGRMIIDNFLNREDLPQADYPYVFRNRRGTALKVLCFDGVGWWLITRRYSSGRIRWWPDQPETALHSLEASSSPFCSIKVCPIRPALLHHGGNFLTPPAAPRQIL